MLHRVHRYVGPPEIAARALAMPGGVEVATPESLPRALAALGAPRAGTFTYVVDVRGALRLADRSSEHVACAGGAPVLAAGELHVEGGRIAWATNLATGYCPVVESEHALRAALERARLARPGSFTAYEMRRCGACGARNVVKDGFECAECDAPLPSEWNFDRVRWQRGWWNGHVVDCVVAPGSRDEDRVRVELGAELRIALADGAGGSGGARDAAEVVVATHGEPAAAIAEADRVLSSRGSGEATAVVAILALAAEVRVRGASVGDSVALAHADGAWIEVTEGQPRKPLVGSGSARPLAFGPLRADAVLVASDGLASYVPRDAVLDLTDGDDAFVGYRIVDLARLPTGALPDDLSFVRARRCAS
jgi:hypothetical protein